MRKLALILALLLALALAVGAVAEGILPVLQTPPPEIVETLSFHRAMNYSSTPFAEPSPSSHQLPLVVAMRAIAFVVSWMPRAVAVRSSTTGRFSPPPLSTSSISMASARIAQPDVPAHSPFLAQPSQPKPAEWMR